MGRFLLFLFLIGFGLGVAAAAGYRLQSENIPHYMDFLENGKNQKVTFRDGTTLVGVVTDEPGDQVKINSGGASVLFPRPDIDSIQPVSGRSPWVLFLENYKKNKDLFPLITYDKSRAFSTKIDRMIMEPSRIADEIRKKHPEITGAGQQAAAMEGLRAVQTQMRAAQQRAIKQMEQMDRGE